MPTAPGASLARQQDISLWLLAVAILMGGLIVVGEVTALVVGMALLASAFILRDFRVGVVLLIILFPLSASPLLPRSIGGITGLNPLNLLLLATLFSLLFAGWRRGALLRLAPPPLLWLYVAPIVLAGLLGTRHVDEIAAVFASADWIEFTDVGGYLRDILLKPLLLVVFAVLTAAAAARSAEPERLIVPLMAAVATMALMTITFVYISGTSIDQLASEGSREFLSQFGMHANSLGRLYAIAYALMLFTWAETRERGLRLALLITMGLLVVALTLTFSRSAFFGFVLVNAWFVLTRRNVAMLLLATIALVALVALLPDAVFQRLATGWDGGLNSATAGRVDGIWLPLLPELAHSPLFGNGLLSITWSEPMRAGAMLQVTHPHNAYLEALLDMGVAGTLLLLAYYFHVLRGFRRLASAPLANATTRGFFHGASVGLATFLITGISGSSLTPLLEQVFLWQAIGMMYGLQLQRALAQGQHLREGRRDE